MPERALTTLSNEHYASIALDLPRSGGVKAPDWWRCLRRQSLFYGKASAIRCQSWLAVSRCVASAFTIATLFAILVSTSHKSKSDPRNRTWLLGKARLVRASLRHVRVWRLVGRKPSLCLKEAPGHAPVSNHFDRAFKYRLSVH